MFVINWIFTRKYYILNVKQKESKKKTVKCAVDQPDLLFVIDRFNTEEEALAIANASNVGLAGESF